MNLLPHEARLTVLFPCLVAFFRQKMDSGTVTDPLQGLMLCIQVVSTSHAHKPKDILVSNNANI